MGKQPAVALMAQVLPVRFNLAFGVPWNITPISKLSVKCRALRGSRLPNPKRISGATLREVTDAVPVTGLAAAL